MTRLVFGWENILYRVSYRNVKYPRLEFKTGELIFILPHGYNPEKLIKKHRRWIIRKIEFIKECLKNSSDKKISKRSDREFKELVNTLAKRNSKKLRVELNNVYLRKMKTKWASLSSKRNLTVNTLMMYLPEYLIEYVIFHEITHIIEKRHNDKFWKIMSREFSNYQELEMDLFAYWFQVFKKG
jgi:hypothetical protein